jgi:hypothetical protein
MTYDEFVLTFIIAITSFALIMFIIANNGDDDGAV